MTKYARDEFDKVPETASRQGVHRTATAAARRRLWPVLAVGIAALAIGLVSFLILPKLGFTQAGTELSTSLEASASPKASSAPSASPESSPSAEPSPGAAASAGPEPSASPSASEKAAVLNKAQGVAVYNAAGTAGLAGRVSSMLQNDGWTLGQVGNWAGAPQQASRIFYAGAAQRANAEALGTLLGVPTLADSQEFQVPLVVVLGPDYR
ncbi:LytR C-terminal domain-containing protein [Pseudarthrobacter sp. H3Y2-7]|jgi:cytoskeletal protein RodZ|uniref:LytR C-terminal domain-containing protein n=1 Tax=Pseudarthrobacter naphthalenicus TaxID=3031328 RepID=UPI0023AF585E|nr:LytR C-terminal domain-containing protein [Pseudarthrobacter sp. H3Y2-7]MDE8669266.1 LytR C-terminal domain-containing protein [Pseudarthrobacter sp. H3Y2-7]